MSPPPRSTPADHWTLEVLEDRAGSTRPDEGFLHLRRLMLANVHVDGTRSRAYPCDMVSRRQQDAVAVVVWGRTPARAVHVVLRENLRPPVWLRRMKSFVQPDARHFDLVPEIVAGLLEETDRGPGGLARRAAAEVLEESGYRVAARATRPLGGPLFPSPGITDEKVFFRHVQVDLARRGPPTGDGSVVEEAGRVFTLPLSEALRRCEDGRIPDMKTEVGLRRLATLLRSRTGAAARRRRVSR